MDEEFREERGRSFDFVFEYFDVQVCLALSYSADWSISEYFCGMIVMSQEMEVI